MNSKLIIVVVIVTLIFFLIIPYYVGLKEASEIFQSFGVGLGALLAGMGGLTAFSDWWKKKRKKDNSIENYRKKYPRSKLNKTYKIIRYEGDEVRIYLLDINSNKRHWVKDPSTLRALGFSGKDAKTEKYSEFNIHKEGEEIG